MKTRAVTAYPASARAKKHPKFFFWWLRWLLALWLGLGVGSGAWAANAWQQTGGPVGGDMSALAVDPLTPTTVYAGTANSGVYKSTDGGATWAPANAGMGSARVVALLIDTTTPTTLYAGGSGVYKSLDAGATWAQVASGITVQSMVMDLGAPAVLYAGTASHGMQKSTDGGASWVSINTGLYDSYVAAVALNPATPTTLYAGTSAGARKSVDAGATWATVGGGLPTTEVFTIAIDPSTPNTVYAGVNNGYVYKSIDGGASWTQAGGAVPGGAYRIFIDPANGSNVYVRTGGGLYKSMNAGANWSPINGQPPYVQALAFDPTNPATLYAGTFSAGVFKSGDAGMTWAAASNGLRASQVNAVVIDPATPTTLYAATEGGVFTSPDAGAHWTALGLATSRVPSLAIDPLAPGTIYAGTGNGLMKTANGGGTWSMADSGIPTYSYITALAVNPSVPGTLYAGTPDSGLYRSVNGGTNWSAPASGLPMGWVHAIAIDPVTPATVYASVGGNVFKSVDSGVNWAAAGSGLPGGVMALAINPLAPSTLYALTSGGRVFKSVDGANAWGGGSVLLYLPGARKALVIDPATPTTLYAASNLVWKSTDGGEQWAEAPSGLRDAGGSGYALSLAIDPQTPATLYVGTVNRAVFKSTNGALSSGSYLSNLELQVDGTPVALLPDLPYTYTATVQGAANVTLKPTAQLNDATITIDGVPIASGSATAPVALSPGANTFSVAVTSGDGTVTSIYTVTVTRQVIAPGVPTNVQAVLGAPGTGQATVSWSPSASGGTSALAGYTVAGGSGCTAGPGGSSCMVSGLVDGTAYTFTVTAANAEGATATSGASNSVMPLASCTFHGNPVLSGSSVTAFAAASVPFGGTCQQEARVCSNGALSGSFAHASCSVAAPASCTFNGQPVAHGQSVTAFLNAAEPAGGSCTPQSRSCSNGALSGSYAHAACQVAPGAPTNVQATPVGGGQVTVTWQPPADAGSGITGYVVTAQPGGQTCTPTPATATTCTFTGLNPAQTYTFTVQATNGGGSATSPAPSNPATPLANPKAFSAPSPTGTGPVSMAVAGGGNACAFESVQLRPASSAATVPPAALAFPHGLLDFVLAGCDANNVTLTITYPSPLPQGVQYWKLQGGTWAPYAGAVAQAGSTTATLTLRDGGPGDDDGAMNGRIVDPGQVAVMAVPGDGAQAVPALGAWALALLVMVLGVAVRRCRPGPGDAAN